MIAAQFPEKLQTVQVQKFLTTSSNIALDCININQFIAPETIEINKQNISYDQASILEILNYQVENKLAGIETAKLFNISTVTLRKWRKFFKSIEN